MAGTSTRFGNSVLTQAGMQKNLSGTAGGSAFLVSRWRPRFADPNDLAAF